MIYADYAAATPTDPAVVRAMEPYWSRVFGNPSSPHREGEKAAAALRDSRQTIARFLEVEPEEVYFTGSGTESNNLALLGVLRSNRRCGNHLITSAIEHPSILNACRALERDDFKVTYLPVDHRGLINPRDLSKAITAQTVLVSFHLANSETGVIQDSATLSRIAHRRQVLIHTDACQAAAYLPLSIPKLGSDLLTFNGSKIYGPKGVAVLYVGSQVDIFPLIYGGGQERSLRSGTENLPGIVGLAKAVEILTSRRDQESERIKKLRDQLQHMLSKKENIKINFPNSSRLPNHLSITLDWAKNRNLVNQLSEQGIAVSAGSACSSRSLSQSHVLTALGFSSQQANATLRLTLGRWTNSDEMRKIAKAVTGLISRRA